MFYYMSRLVLQNVRYVYLLVLSRRALVRYRYCLIGLVLLSKSLPLQLLYLLALQGLLGLNFLVFLTFFYLLFERHGLPIYLIRLLVYKPFDATI